VATPPVTVPELLTQQQRTTLLIDALRGYQVGFNTSAYSTMGFLVVAAGWLVTSSDARSFLMVHPGVVNAGIGAMVLGSLAFVVVAFRVYRLSARIAKSLEVMPGTQGVYEHYRITAVGVCAYLVALGAVVTLILSILLAIRENASQVQRTDVLWRCLTLVRADAPKTARRSTRR